MIALPVLVGLVLATPAAGAVSFVIHGDTKIGTYAVQADGSLAGVIRAFGEPARLWRTVEGCSGVWPSYGLTVDVYNVGGQSPCTPKYGRFSKAVMHGKRSSFAGVKGRDQVPEFVDRYLAGEIDVESFVSQKLTLDDVNRGFELIEARTESAA
jgi:Zn-dependent alcohol dehydrogenase